MGWKRAISYAKKIKDIKNWVNAERSAGLSNTFAFVKGRMFERWIDSVLSSVRSNGYNTGDLIQNPAYIIESLLRDENFTERDLKIYTIDPGLHKYVTINNLVSSEDDYYKYALYYNVTTDHLTHIVAYDGGAKTFELSSADLSGSANDDVYITNIRGDYKIDYASFDVIGNTTNGNRKDWLFDRCYTEKENISDILDELLNECHCELIENANPITGETKIRIIALDSGTGDTWTNPAYKSGIELSDGDLTPLDNIYTSFRLKYFYDYGSGEYLKEIYVDKNGFPSTATILSATEQTLCADAESNYFVSQLYEYSSENIYDDATAEKMLQKKIEWYTKQHLILSWTTQLTGNTDFIKYEIGDQIKLNFSKSVPSGMNNSTYFMIIAKRIIPLTGGGDIEWTLMEL